MSAATTSTLFIATTKETTKEVPRPKAAAPLLWWRPKAATFVVAMNRVDVVAADTIFVLRLSKSGWTEAFAAQSVFCYHLVVIAHRAVRLGV